MIRVDVGKAELSNDRVMKLGKERLQIRIRLMAMLVQKFWNEEMTYPKGVAPHKYLVWLACKSFPLLHHMG